MDTPLNLCLKNNTSETSERDTFQASCSAAWNISSSSRVAPVRHSWSEDSTSSSLPGRSPQIVDRGTEHSIPHLLLAPVKPRGPKRPVPESLKDERYFKRRQRNNEAAKRSRTARKERQEAQQKRIMFMEIENAALSSQVQKLREEYVILMHLLEQQRNMAGRENE